MYSALWRQSADRIYSLQQQRPTNISARNWETAVEWAHCAFGNTWPVPGDMRTDFDNLEEFAAGLDRKIAAGDSLATLRWIWEQLEQKTESGAQYAAHYKPLRQMTPEPINDDTVGDIWYLETCQRLDLSNTEVGDAGLRRLAKARNARELSLANAPVTDSGLGYLLELPQLRSLDLTRCGVTGAGLADLKRLKFLEGLKLGNTRITDEHLEALKEFPSLKELQLNGTAITDDGLARFSQAAQLTFLDLSGTCVGDGGVAHLSTLPRLWRLNLSDTRITNQSLHGILNCRQLQHLDLPKGMSRPGRFRGFDFRW